MGIKIKQFGNEWRLVIKEEALHFEKRIDMEKNLKVILDIKEKYGKVN